MMRLERIRPWEAVPKRPRLLFPRSWYRIELLTTIPTCLPVPPHQIKINYAIQAICLDEP
jgi:hypothetical protein